MIKIMTSIMSLLLSLSIFAEGNCEASDYQGSKYKEAIEFFTSLKPVEGLGDCVDLVLPEVDERIECNIWNSNKFRGYSYFFVLPYHEKFGPQGHYFMIGENTTQTVWTIGSKNRGDWFTTRISKKVEIEVANNSMSWVFKQGLHKIVSTLEKDDGDNLIRFQAKAYKRGLLSSEYKLKYNTVCE